jgi:hypothetical protein
MLYGRSAINVSSFANGAWGEHRRHDTDGIRLEIAAPGVDGSRVAEIHYIGGVIPSLP